MTAHPRFNARCIDCGAVRSYGIYSPTAYTRPRCKPCVRRVMSELSSRKRDPAKTVVFSCATCGKTVHRPLCLAKCVKTVGTCSRECFWAAVRSGQIKRTKPRLAPSSKRPKYYGMDWKAQSALARQRDGDRCRNCGITRADYGRTLDVHHIVRFQDFETSDAANVLSNLLTLCCPCHRQADDELYRARRAAGQKATRRQRQPPKPRQFPVLAELVCVCARNWRLTTYSGRVENECAGSLSKVMKWADTQPKLSRGLHRATDRCQVRSLPQCNAEIEADCWRFTLADATEPDPRPWAELLASGDHKRVVLAERVAFLDWHDTCADIIWSANRSVGGPKMPNAARRLWAQSASTIDKRENTTSETETT